MKNFRLVGLFFLVGFIAFAKPAIAQERSINYPDFSWEKVPQYIHIRKAAAFTDEEIKFLSGFPLITLEKTTGSATYGSTDQGSIMAAKAIKTINPNAKILYYRNVICHYGGNTFDKELMKIQAPFLVDQKNGKGKLIRGTVEAYDLSNKAFRDWWVKSAAKICNSKYIDGLFLDGNIKVLEPGFLLKEIGADKKEQVKEGYLSMMASMREALNSEKLMLANIIRARLPESGLEYINYFDGSYLEGFTAPVNLSYPEYLAKGIDAVQRAAQSGKIITMNFGLGESANTTDKIDDTRSKLKDTEGVQDLLNYYMSIFLVCAEKYSYLNIHDGYSVNTKNGVCDSKVWLQQFPEFDKPLGEPKGSATKVGYSYTREFEHASVWVDIEARKGKVTWK
ncbi:putative glycoside hydrolase [Mangrovibacterium sp.]|uniref:putative glycoside hydrolase n=1 Tax=Mangrovibacterium sp. TaxID=1961364 RepID=UPI0035681C29